MEDKCKFDLAWIGSCSKPAVAGFCEKHKPIKCCSCGEQATHECAETMGLVCGAPLCGNCEHTIQSNGCNSRGELPIGLKGHCRKDEQVYKPWYVKDVIETPSEPFPKFWYESNACWGYVGNSGDLVEKANLQMDPRNGNSIKTIDDFLDKSTQCESKSLNFGTRGEHTGDLTLREFLDQHGHLEHFLKTYQK